MNGSLGISICFSKRKEKYALIFSLGKEEKLSLHFPVKTLNICDLLAIPLSHNFDMTNQKIQ
jgi:hypothetical protein